jgi:hypothetical protein
LTFELVRPRETLKVQIWKLLQECNLFGDAVMQLNAPSAVLAPISVDELREFVLALEEKHVELTNAHIGGLSLFSDKHGFWSF